MLRSPPGGGLSAGVPDRAAVPTPFTREYVSPTEVRKRGSYTPQHHVRQDASEHQTMCSTGVTSPPSRLSGTLTVWRANTEPGCSLRQVVRTFKNVHVRDAGHGPEHGSWLARPLVNYVVSGPVRCQQPNCPDPAGAVRRNTTAPLCKFA